MNEISLRAAVILGPDVYFPFKTDQNGHVKVLANLQIERHFIELSVKLVHKRKLRTNSRQN